MPFQKGHPKPKNAYKFPKGHKINVGKHRTIEEKIKLSEFQTGRKRSEATRMKMGKAHMGIKNSGAGRYKHKPHTEEWKEKMSKLHKLIGSGKRLPHFVGENSPQWKGDDVGYCGLHKWVQAKLGKPGTCEFCGKTGLWGRQIHWANKDHKYRRNIKDWLRLCLKCHKEYDLKNF